MLRSKTARRQEKGTADDMPKSKGIPRGRLTAFMQISKMGCVNFKKGGGEQDELIRGLAEYIKIEKQSIHGHRSFCFFLFYCLIYAVKQTAEISIN